MTNNEMLQADVLDILFANRNKAYGAYALRKTYPQRLLLATGAMAALTTGLFLVLFRNADVATVAPLPEAGAVVLTQVEIPRPVEPEVPKPPAAAEPVATRQYTSVIDIVPDQQAQDKELPPVEELSAAAVGTQNIEGAAFDGNQQPPQTAAAPPAEVPAPPAEPEFYENVAVDQMAEFPGGAGAFQRYLAKHLPQPDDLEPGQTKTMKVRFVIEKDGTIDKIFVVQSGGDALDAAVVKVFRKAPRWKPARHHNREVAVVFTQPVTFMGGEE